MQYVYSVSSKEGRKYFQTYCEAHVFHKKHPELDDDYSSLVSSRKVEKDQKGRYYIATEPWGMPEIITIEPSTHQTHDESCPEPCSDGESEDCCSDSTDCCSDSEDDL